MPATENRVEICSFESVDFDLVRKFVEAIQEYERAQVPELKHGQDIGLAYTQKLVDSIADPQRQGLILIAKNKGDAIGFACAWIASDDDSLLSEEARSHAYVSDIFVDEAWRGQGVASLLLESVENEMSQRGCNRIRICSKASNSVALKCYAANGYRPYEIIFSKSLLGSSIRN